MAVIFAVTTEFRIKKYFKILKSILKFLKFESHNDSPSAVFFKKVEITRVGNDPNLV